MTLDFIDRLNSLIEDKGLNNYEIARSIGVSEGAVRSWRTGRTRPHADHNENLAEFLGVNPSWLLTGKGEFAPSVKDAISRISHRLAKYGEKNPGGLKQIERIINILTEGNMKKSLLYLVMSITCCSSVYAEDAQVFTDSDLRRYSSPSDGRPYVAPSYQEYVPQQEYAPEQQEINQSDANEAVDRYIKDLSKNKGKRKWKDSEAGNQSMPQASAPNRDPQAGDMLMKTNKGAYNTRTGEYYTSDNQGNLHTPGGDTLQKSGNNGYLGKGGYLQSGK